MAVTKTTADNNHRVLAQAIGRVIQEHTTVSPMTQEQIIAVLAYCAGAAIGQSVNRSDRRMLKEMAEANVNLGIEFIVGTSGSILILPEGMH